MKLLCTGLSGYVGSNLIRHMQDHGHVAVNYDIKNGYDLLDTETLNGLMYGCDAVIHLAALPDISYCEENIEEAVTVNVHGTFNVVGIAGKHGIPVIFLSTAAAKTPRNVYGLTKRLGEKIVLSSGGTVLRCSNVYGGTNYLENKRSAISNFINAWKQGDLATIHGDGSHTRDFIHIDDVCRAILAALKAPPRIYDVYSGTTASILELANIIGVDYKLAPKRLGDVEILDVEQDDYVHGWTPQVSLENGLKELKS